MSEKPRPYHELLDEDDLAVLAMDDESCTSHVHDKYTGTGTSHLADIELVRAALKLAALQNADHPTRGDLFIGASESFEALAHLIGDAA